MRKEIWSLKDTIGFGSDEYSTVKFLIDNKLNRIAWYLENVTYFKLNEEATTYYQNKVNNTVKLIPNNSREPWYPGQYGDLLNEY